MKRAFLQTGVLTLVCLAMLFVCGYFIWAPVAVLQAATYQQGSATPTPTGEQEALVFTPSLTGVDAIMQTRRPASALAAYLSEASGVPVSAFVPTDYGATLQGLARGRYDIVYLPGPFLVKAQAELGVIPAFAVSINGAITETGLIVTGADSGIEELADLAGKSVGAADLESGTGWVMPAAALKEAGINPLTDIEVYFTGTDPENIIAVLNGELDAAFVSASALEDPAVTEADPDAAEKLAVLAEFPDVPIGVIAFSKDVAEADREALIAAFSAPELAEVTDADGNPALAALGWDGLVPAGEVDFTALTEAATALGMIKAGTQPAKTAPAATASAPVTESAEITPTAQPTAEAEMAEEEATATEAITTSESVTATEPVTDAESVTTTEETAASAAMPTPTPTGEQEALVFTPSLTGVDAIMQTRRPASALAAYLSEASGVPVSAFVPTDYGATLQGLERGRYDIVYLPGPFLVKAQAELGVIPAFAVSVNGVLTETGIIIVKADSGIEELADLAGKSVGAADLESGTGWVMPAAALKEAGINPLTDIEVYFTGTDPENVVAVLNGELDAAFVSASALEDPAVTEADPDAAEKLAVLAEFPDVPIGGIVFAASVDEADREALIAALSAPELAEVTDADGNPALAALGWDGLAPAGEVDFTALTEAATALGMIKNAE